MYKNDFPIFKNHPDLVYLDSAATAQKPQRVIDAVSEFYTKHNSNVHRGVYDLSNQATELYEGTRKKVADFIHAKTAEEIIFTANASAGINYVASGWAKKHLKRGDIIVLSEMEHHSNIVPWLRLRDEIGVQLVWLPVDKEYELDYKVLNSKSEARNPRQYQNTNDQNLKHFEHSDFKDLEFVSSFDIRHSDFKKIKLVSLTHASNVLGTVNPVKEIIQYFKDQGVEAKYLVDAAQSVPHLPIDVQDLDCDFLVCSSHKMLGPSGVGVLWGKKELLEEMDPFFVGSHMIATVSKEKATWQDVPHRFEVGTGSLEGIVGLGAAIDYLQGVGMDKIVAYEQELTEYGLERLGGIEGVELYGPKGGVWRLGVFSFGIGDVHAHDIAEILNRKHVAIRSGHHCAQPLMQCLNVSSTARASFYLYNTKEDVDRLVEGIEEVRRVFKR